MRKTSKISYYTFRVIRYLVSVFYGKAEIVGLDSLPERDFVVVANHTQMNGPIMGELFMPDDCLIWCAGQMMHLKEVPEYAFTDFWSQKPKWTHPFYRLLSYIIAPLAAAIFSNAKTIPVYHDARILSTFRETVSALKDGKSILIFPEKDEKKNNIVYQFQENFVDVAKLYYKRTGAELTFVPMYVAPDLKKAFIGKGVVFNSETPIEDERKRICNYLSDEITTIGRELPEHTVIPYRNIGRKNYLSNKDFTEVPK